MIWNILWANITHIKKSYHSFWHLTPSRYESDLSNEVHHSCRSRGFKNIRGQTWRSNKICRFSRAPGVSLVNLAESEIFFPTSRFDLKYLCSLLTFKNIMYLIWKIWLKEEVQSYGMTFNVWYVGSKYPYFISYRGSRQNRYDGYCSRREIVYL